MSKQIFITGATGHYGKATIDFLLKKGAPANSISVLVRDEARAADLKSKGINIHIGDYDNYNSMVNAFKGADQLLLISGNDIAKRSTQQANAIKAAKEAGVKHILYTSFERKNETDTSPIAFLAQSHIDTDRAIKQSGLNYTILRNNLYMDTLPMFLGEQVLKTGVFFPAGDAKSAFAARQDMAEATANILLSDGHENKEYALNNTENYSFEDVAKTLSTITQHEVAHINPSAEIYSQTLKNAGVPGEYIGMFAGFAEAIKQGEFHANQTDLEKLLGRKPINLETYLKGIYASKHE